MTTSNCPASIRYMEWLNSEIKPYGTRYLLSETLAEGGCIFKYICENGCSFKSQEDYFHTPPYPNEIIKLAEKGKECEKLKEYTNKICDYYGFYRTKEIEKESDVLDSLTKGIWDENRTVFGREYDRIICTNAFRHLQYKTQVMVNSASDDQRTRLLHSLEVQRIAKKIAMGIGANWELAETIAIAHDIGHAPFGHGGEFTINEYLLKNDCGRFSHALQSVKVLDSLCVHPILDELSIEGLGVSQYVLEGVLKHDSDSFTDGMETDNFKAQYNVENLCGIVGENSSEYAKELKEWIYANGDFSNPKIPQVLIGSIESQIVAWADKIAYLGHDWEEFIDTLLLEKLMSRVNDLILKMHHIVNNTQIPKDKEQDYLKDILSELKAIGERYAEAANDTDEETFKRIWKEGKESVYNRIDNIISYINKIVNNGNYVSKDNPTPYFRYFSHEEYNMLKNYLLMTISWVELLEVYPRSYAMKEDPVYVFYMYLTKVRSNIISPKVVRKIIDGTLKYISDLQSNPEIEFSTRLDYLLHCNKLWTYKYNNIVGEKDSKALRKSLKDTVRTCFLVGFHDTIKDEGGNIINEQEYIVKRKENDYYDYNNAYGCLLNIIKIVLDEFIDSTRVRFMKHTANEIVTELLDYYVEHPEMLPYSQRNRLNKQQYCLSVEEVPEMSEADRIVLSKKNIIRVVADYVAGMTDRMAKLKYDEIKSSDTKWRNQYAN